MPRHSIEIYANLPVESLDRLSLQQRLDEIGNATVTTDAN